MLGKSHSALMKDINGSKDGKSVGIIPILLKSNFDLSKYFIENSYKDASGKTNKCYEVTKMGCEMLGNKQQKFLGFNIPVIEGGFGENQKVMLAKTIAEIHEMELRKVNELINNNISEFEIGIDLLDLKNSILTKDSLLEVGFTNQKIANSKNIYLLSEQVYFALVMLMRSEKAKEKLLCKSLVVYII
ncbi:Rha family transcriptional regulator [Clostridium sp.]|uniref:Rha family transcriptional regulator n=1 Tax=Clostridium sp. TaxID=1506 RepID=UPI002633BC3C|nr:Rha family transcriptional regulator [Clostridium sp.]